MQPGEEDGWPTLNKDAFAVEDRGKKLIFLLPFLTWWPPFPVHRYKNID